MSEEGAAMTVTPSSETTTLPRSSTVLHGAN